MNGATLITGPAAVQGSAEWKEHRTGHANASESASVLCIHPWYPKNPRELMSVKRGGTVVYETPAMRAGAENEWRVREWLEETLQTVLRPCVLARTINGVPYSASMDGIDMDGAVLVEIKWPSRGVDSETWRAVASGVVPVHYQAQVQTQMMVAECREAVFAVGAIRNGELAVVFVHVGHDPDMQARIRSAWEEFWPAYVRGETVGERDDTAWQDAAGAWLSAKEMLTRAEENEKAARTRLIELGGGEGCGVKAKLFKRVGNVDYKRIPELRGVDLERYRGKETEFWRIERSDS